MMYPIDVPMGYTEHWKKIVSIYPPIDATTMATVLGGGYPGQPTSFPTTREVRVSDSFEIELWERTVRPIETKGHP